MKTRVSKILIVIVTLFYLLSPGFPAFGEIRVIAEWEPAVGTLVSWPLGIPQQLVVELARDDLLFVLVRNHTHEEAARATFTSWGIDETRVHYIVSTVQTHWPRDWGPHQIFDDSGTWSVVDQIFEGYPWVSNECLPITSPGGYSGDNQVNSAIATYFNAPLVDFPAYLTGGNFLVDGHNRAFSTCAMVGENQQLWTESEFMELTLSYLGISRYAIVDNTEDYGIQHIDCWMKPLNEETLLVKRAPPGHEEYERLEANVAYLQTLTTCYDRPYKIIRIDCPAYDGYNIAAYTNSLILNTKILVPQFNIAADSQALDTFRQAMPGYEIIGFPWESWYYYDALHCRTRAVFDRFMLRMTHKPLDESMPFQNYYEIIALIDDRSEAGLDMGQLRVFWRTRGEGEWQSIPLQATALTDHYAARLYAIPPGETVEYYIAAADHSSRSETLPRTAPEGFYSFTVDGGSPVPALNIAGFLLILLFFSLMIYRRRAVSRSA